MESEQRKTEFWTPDTGLMKTWQLSVDWRCQGLRFLFHFPIWFSFPFKGLKGAADGDSGASV
jgi:hypothetical protein